MSQNKYPLNGFSIARRKSHMNSGQGNKGAEEPVVSCYLFIPIQFLHRFSSQITSQNLMKYNMEVKTLCYYQDHMFFVGNILYILKCQLSRFDYLINLIISIPHNIFVTHMNKILKPCGNGQ